MSKIFPEITNVIIFVIIWYAFKSEINDFPFSLILPLDVEIQLSVLT